MTDLVTRYFREKMKLQIARFNLEDDLLRQVNAGEVYYSIRSMVTKRVTDCNGKDIEVSVGQWRDVETE